MGGVQSRLKTLRLALKALLQIDKQFQELLERAKQPPGLPVPNPSKSYWLEDPPFPELVDIQSPELPDHADIVIIGSGITGAAVARSVLRECERKGESRRIVVLEARTLCSGATGRNGGHMKSSPHELFVRLKDRYGPERAAALTRFQLSHVEVLTKLCENEGWDLAECRKVETVDLYLDTEDRDKAFGEVRELSQWIPELEIEMHNAVEAQKKFEVNRFIVGAISYTAGALWPYRLVVSAWKDLLAKYAGSLSIETGTAVTDINPSSNGVSAYSVLTTRGSISCNHVVHATNGFAGQFIPGLRSKMSGFQAHMSAQRPGRQFPEYNGSRSWSVVYGKAYDYVTQRPTVDGVPGDIMLGGGFDRGKDQGMNVIGRWDDSEEGFDALTINHIGNIFPTVFSPHWGEDQVGGRMKKVWSGIVCMTGDFLPFVGRLNPKLTERQPNHCETTGGVSAGEWVAAGYCGDGMVWAWLSGTALGAMIMGSEKEVSAEGPGGKVEDWFPHELMPTLSRVKKADLANMAEYLL
ncbi:putative FAD dependent oxidoreductase-domain-containing protein [Seiridium cardinale]|uniref:FAD dependent oxidoreductase-domain-containing protein n=1 Tax=Seiridium cardinale TaxID=138064 RepID=A0ABR2XZZ0_9PEZI